MMTRIPAPAPHAAALACIPRLVVADGVHLVQFDCMKAVPALSIIEQGLRSGEIGPETKVIESSSGTFALGLALACQHYGLECIIVCDPAIDARLQRRLSDLGCQIDIVKDCPPNGGYQKGRLDRLEELRRAHPGSFWPRQYSNPQNPASYFGLARSLMQRLGPGLALVATVGSGGSSAGFGTPMREQDPSTPIFAVDTFQSVLFGQPDGKRLLRGLGNSLMPGNVDHALFDEVHFLDAETGFAATRQLHRQHGIFAGPTTGSAWWVARWMARQFPSRTVVALGPDDGHRYIDTVYDDTWLEQHAPCSSLTAEPTRADGLETLETPWARLDWGRRTVSEFVGQQRIA